MNNQNVTKRSIEHLEKAIDSKKVKIANISMNLQNSRNKLQNLKLQIEILEKSALEEKEKLQYLQQEYQKDILEKDKEKTSPKREENSKLLPIMAENLEIFQEEMIEVADFIARESNCITLGDLREHLPKSMFK